MIPYLKPRPNWGRIKYSDSFIFEMKQWNQSIRHNFKTGIITFYQYLDSGNLTHPVQAIDRAYAIRIIQGYVRWMNRMNKHLEFKMTSSNQDRLIGNRR